MDELIKLLAGGGAAGATGGASLIPMLFGTAGNLFSTFYGAHQMMNGLNGYPTYHVNQNIINNQKIGSQLGSTGLPSATKNEFVKEAESGFNTSVNTIEQGGGGINSVADTYSRELDAFGKLYGADAAEKDKHKMIQIQTNKDLADEQGKAFNWNEALKYQLGLQLDQAGAANIVNGLRGEGGVSAASKTGFDLNSWLNMVKGTSQNPAVGSGAGGGSSFGP